MKLDRRQFLRAGVATVAAPALIRSAHAASGEITLRLHHFLPPVSNVHAALLAPWARKLETQSAGRLKIDIFPSMQLGGTPAQLYDQARDGMADIVWTLPGSTPGRFPGIEVFELPFIAHRRALTNARAVQEFCATHLREEFRDVHPLCVWAHDSGVLHTNRPIRALEDLKGLKVRSPTRLAGETLDALGAMGTPMPISQVQSALFHKVLDGCVVPWEVVPAVRIQDHLRFHTGLAGSSAFYTATFVLAMNRQRYAALPADLRQILDDNSGQAFAILAGRMWDEQAVVVEEMVRERGNTVATLGEAETARWRKASRPVVERWLRLAGTNGLNGEKLLADAKALLAKYSDA